jgi:hypothetical protein
MVSKTIVIGIGLTALAACAVNAGPALELPEYSFSFGKVVQNAVVTHGFWVRSTGDDTLRITKIDPGCGCTQVPLRDSSIAPGDSVLLKIILDTKRFTGFVGKRPSFTTNAGDTVIGVKIYAEMVLIPDSTSPVVLSPPRVAVSQFSTTPHRRGQFTIENRADSDVEITAVDTSGRSFSVSLPEKIEKGGSAEAAILVHEDAVETTFQESITFEATSADERSRYSVPVQRIYRPESPAE